MTTDAEPSDEPKPKPKYRRKDHPHDMRGLRPISKEAARSPDFVGRATQFGGPRGNPQRMTGEHRKAMHKAAELAAIAQVGWLEALAEQIDAATLPEAALASLRADTLRLVQDALDRAHGKAVQQVDSTSSDGSAAAPTTIRIVSVKPDDRSDD